LNEQVAAVLGLAQPPDPQLGFNELGMDSLMSLELRQRLAKSLQVNLPATVIFEYPSITTLLAYLLQEFFDSAPSEPEASAPMDPGDVMHAVREELAAEEEHEETDGMIGADVSGLEDKLLALETLLGKK